MGNKVLVKEHLADVRGNVSDVGPVVIEGTISRLMSNEVDMDGATGVVAREKGDELDDALVVGLLKAAKESGVDVTEVRGVTIALRDD